MGLHNHRTRSTAKHPYYCSECRIEFDSESNHYQHRNSAIHLPAIKPCGLPGCDKKFIHTGAVVLHWEGGACPSGIDAVDTYRLALAYDYERKITVRNVDRMRANQPINEAMARRFTSHRGGYRCLDRNCGATFKVAYASMQHYNAEHVTSVFKCPNQTCSLNGQFPSLAALGQHLLSNACGARKMQDVRETWLGILNRIRLNYRSPGTRSQTSWDSNQVECTGYAEVLAY
ncbi:hypothetical protein CVT24_000243 [Panaeolus cyanescens]|uniref:C2H2-type domain-containing protein n=1 Tax=Panaeolus cyanescens TaxID=181874 RepID=A0A409VIH6_9AGAR|nr:hypothetical protein CVT24_000243 [Panaeolus cyanescens]